MYHLFREKRYKTGNFSAIVAGSIFFWRYIKEATVIPIKAIPTELLGEEGSGFVGVGWVGWFDEGDGRRGGIERDEHVQRRDGVECGSVGVGRERSDGWDVWGDGDGWRVGVDGD